VGAGVGSATLKAPEKPMKANLLTLAVVIITLAFLVAHAAEVVWSAPKVIGAAIAGISFPLFVLARWQLGSSFSIKAKAGRLVTTGLYSRIRNPIYLFGGLFTVGVSLFLSVWGPLVVALVLVPLQVARAHREERVLADAFGEEYERYKSETWF
jgi:protein-S-isoprenylcysteine O-methyltransferase Ste14